MIQIISANRLTDGRIVYRDAGGVWRTEIAAAARLTDKAALDSAMDGARTDMAANLVIEVEAIELSKDGAHPVAATMRNRIRMSGPSILETGARATTTASAVKSEQNDVSI